jgi:hypothetical protein
MFNNGEHVPLDNSQPGLEDATVCTIPMLIIVFALFTPAGRATFTAIDN